MANLHLVAAIPTNEYGEPYWNYCTVDATGLCTGTIYTGFHLSKSDIDDSTDQKDKPDEGGNIFTSDGQQKVKIKFTSMQMDKASKDIATKTLRGQVAAICKLESNDINDKVQVTFYPYCHVNPSFKKASPGDEFEVEFTPMPCPTSQTITLASWDANFPTALTGTISLVTGDVYVIYEQ